MDQSQEFVEILSNQRCLIRGKELGCAEVATYLREVLKLNPGHLVRVRANPSVKLEADQLHAIFDSLKKAGFSTYTAIL